MPCFPLRTNMVFSNCRSCSHSGWIVTTAWVGKQTILGSAASVLCTAMGRGTLEIAVYLVLFKKKKNVALRVVRKLAIRVWGNHSKKISSVLVLGFLNNLQMGLSHWQTESLAVCPIPGVDYLIIPGLSPLYRVLTFWASAASSPPSLPPLPPAQVLIPVVT